MTLFSTQDLSKELLIALLNNVSEGLIITDKEYNIKYAFPSALNLLNIQELPENANIIDFLVDSGTLSNNNKYQTVKFKDVQSSSQLLTISVINYDEDTYLLKIFPDEEKYLLVNDLINDTNKAMLKNKIKSAFLASMSHDLRTPMHSVIGFSQALLDGIGGDLQEKHEKYIAIINRNANTLLKMLNNILDLSKIEAGKMVFKPEPVNLKAFVNTMFESLQPVVKNKSLELKVEYNDLAVEEITIDVNMLSQILINLLENSIKYTESGYVLLKFEHPSKEILKEHLPKSNKNLSEKEYILVSVSDSGKGIPEDQLDLIFDEYYNTDEGQAKKYGSTGLGLTIAKKIIDCFEGSIWVDSKVNEGSTFNFILPVNSTITSC